MTAQDILQDWTKDLAERLGVLEARVHQPITIDSPTPPEEIMWMPAGVHNVWVGKNGKPVNVTLLVDQQTAKALQDALTAHQAEGLKPYFDLNHEDAAASGWPVQFLWRDSPGAGVYAKVEWSSAGRDAITGKEFRAFSPAFRVNDEKAKPATVKDAPVNMGGLVNKPAFRKNLPLWAKSSEGQSQTNNMNETESADLHAKLAKLEKENAELKAKAASSEQESALEAKEAEITELKGKIVSFEEAEKTQRKQNAKDKVDAALARGAIPPKDETLKAKWLAALEADPSADVLLAAMPSQTGLRQPQDKGTLQAKITRESNGAVLRGYSVAATPKERGALYASEIRPRLNEGDDIALTAADVTDANLGTIQSTLLTQRILDLYKLEFNGILRMIATDFSDTNATLNQTIISRIVVVPATEDYNTSTGWVQNTAAQTTDVPVTITAHKGVPLSFNANILASTVRQLFNEQAPAASYALGKLLIEAVYAVLTVGNYTDPVPIVQTDAQWGRRTFTKVGATFNKGGVPQMNRFALINSDSHEVLENDPTVMQLAVFQRENIITEGTLPKIKKFTPIEAPNLPTTSDMRAFFGHKSSLCLATRLPNDYTQALPGASNGSVTTVTDPDTGISVMLVQYIDHKLGTANWRIALMYGAAKGNPKGGLIVKSA